MIFRMGVTGLCLLLALPAQAGPFERGSRDLLFRALDLDWAPLLPEVTAPGLAEGAPLPQPEAAITLDGHGIRSSVMRILGEVVLKHRISVRLKF